MKHLRLTLLAILFSICAHASVPIDPISGAGNVCQGSNLPLSDGTSGGTWTSHSPSVATVGSSSGIVTGVSAGTSVITYTVGGSYVIATVTVNPLPDVYSLYVVGSGGICAGSAGASIYLSGSQSGFSYQLYNGTTPVGSAISGMGTSVNFGAETSAGSYTAIATNPATTCATNMADTATITILPTPASIGGPSSVCVGGTVNLTDATGGGAWSSSNPSVATIGSGGTVSGATAGSTVISYTLSSGCAAITTINAINTISSITGPSNICTGTPANLSDASAGGTWTSSNPAVATIGSSSGVISGLSAGTTVINYTVSGTCGAASSTVTVNLAPDAITGVTGICAGAVSTLSDLTSGGTWNSSNPAIATIGSTGIATSVSAGTDTISYTVAGCSAKATFTIAPRPVISGPSSVCVTSFIILNTSINGSWTSSNPAVATVTTGYMEGIVTGVYPGSTVLTCTSYATGCVSTYTVTVTSVCTGTPSAGAAHALYPSVCSGNADTLYLTGYSSGCGISFQWQYSSDSLAWANIAGATGDSDVIYPQATLYYRCRLTCFTSGLYSYSPGVRVSIYNHITSQSVINTPATSCSGPDFHIATCGVSPGSNILTYYGDGTSDSTHLFSYVADSSTIADIYHNYSLPGAYTIKQVLRDGDTRQDSVTFSYSYNYCHTLPVFFYFDTYTDCTYGPGDGSFYQPVTTQVDSNGIAIDTITAVNGFYYEAKGDSGTIYEFRVLSYDTGLHMECPATGILYDTIGSFANTYVQKSFAFTATSSPNFNLGISANLACATSVADGFIEVNNTYATSESPVVTMTFSPKYNFSGSWPAPYSISGNTVTWHLSPLTAYIPSGSTWPYIWYQLAPVGTLTAGDTVNSSYKITPYAGDVDTANNFVSRVDTITSSCKLDRISVSPRGLVIPCTPLQYTINFENTGADTVQNITVIDTLPANVDPNSVMMVGASGVAFMTVVQSGPHPLVKFDFPQISLPDSAHHNQCRGAVIFTVNAKQGLADGTTITNHAAIYFDDNQPALTDTVGNVIGISPVTGPSSVCDAQHVQLNDESEFGTWSSSNAHAFVSSGFITGVSAGTDTIVYTLSNTCVTRTVTKVVTVDAIVVPAVSITNSMGAGDTVCNGIIPVFTALPTNGGAAPSYLWQVNGSGTGTGSTYSYGPSNDDTLSVKMISNASCAAPDSATAEMILTVVYPYPSSVLVNAYPSTTIGTGDADTFVATIPPGGPAPTYQWLLNGIAVSGATTDTFTSSTFSNNDSVTCVVTSTDLCQLSTFNSLIVMVIPEGVKNIVSTAEIILSPNPNNGTFTLKGNTGNVTDNDASVEITNMLGEAVYKTNLTLQNGTIDALIQPDIVLPKGVYLLSLRTGESNTVFRFVVQ